MQHYRRILVGVDFVAKEPVAAKTLPASTREAVNRALWLAETTHAQVTFLCVAGIPDNTLVTLPVDDETLANTATHSARDLLTELVGEAEARGIAATGHCAFGTDWQEITRHALHDETELVLVGSRHDVADGLPVIGTVGMNLMRYCPCTVWIVTPEPMPETPHVLIASDLSDTMGDAIHLMVSLGQLVDTKTRLVHVADTPLDLSPWRAALSDEQLQTYCEQMNAVTEEKLHEQLSLTDWRTLSFGVLVHVLNGSVPDALLQAIHEYEIDWLVMGTIGNSYDATSCMGGTAERVLSRARCSVIALKPATFECPIKLIDTARG